jgi:hypothetical protein
MKRGSYPFRLTLHRQEGNKAEKIIRVAILRYENDFNLFYFVTMKPEYSSLYNAQAMGSRTEALFFDSWLWQDTIFHTNCPACL